MVLTVSPHAMWGLKATLEKGENINESIEYTLILDDKTKPVLKNPNTSFYNYIGMKVFLIIFFIVLMF